MNARKIFQWKIFSAERRASLRGWGDAKSPGLSHAFRRTRLSGDDRIAIQTLTFCFSACLATKPVSTFVGQAHKGGKSTTPFFRMKQP